MSKKNHNSKKKKNEESFEEFKKSIAGSQYDNKIQGFIEPEDEIEFDCQRCGKCCQHRDDPNEMIFVSPLDIYNGAKKLGITPERFMDEYTEYHIGPQSGVIVAVLSCKENGDCKLLEFDENGLAKCKIHDSKPTICAIHPLGIVHARKLDADHAEEKHYIIASHCDTSQTGKMIKASDIINTIKGTDEEVEMAMEVRTGWIPEFGVKQTTDVIMLHALLSTAACTPEEKEEYGISDRFFGIATKAKTAFERAVGPCGVTKADMNVMLKDSGIPGMLYDANLKIVYLNYDLDKEFLPQCKENLEGMREIMKIVTEHKDMVYNEITANLTEEQKKRIPDFLKYLGAIIHQ